MLLVAENDDNGIDKGTKSLPSMPLSDRYIISRMETILTTLPCSVERVERRECPRVARLV